VKWFYRYGPGSLGFGHEKQRVAWRQITWRNKRGKKKFRMKGSKKKSDWYTNNKSLFFHTNLVNCIEKVNKFQLEDNMGKLGGRKFILWNILHSSSKGNMNVLSLRNLNEWVDFNIFMPWLFRERYSEQTLLGKTSIRLLAFCLLSFCLQWFAYYDDSLIALYAVLPTTSIWLLSFCLLG